MQEGGEHQAATQEASQETKPKNSHSLLKQTQATEGQKIKPGLTHTSMGNKPKAIQGGAQGTATKLTKATIGGTNPQTRKEQTDLLGQTKLVVETEIVQQA